MNEIEEAEDISAKLRSVQEPFADAFRIATATLETIWLTRKSGRQIPSKIVLAAYDARVTAGHQWNPHRIRYQETLRWLKTLRMELKDVNREIGT